MKSLLLVITVIGLFAQVTLAQDSLSSVKKDTVPLKPSKFQYSFMGFLDFYYAYDFNKPADHTRTSFEYNHNKHNQFALNVALLRGQVSYNNRVRASLGAMVGAYVSSNLATEPVPARYIYEANGGVRIVKNLWVDGGVFTSHIGFEGVISKDQWTLTRSIIADNTPYYLTGLRATWQINDKWTVTAIVCQGWQNMKETPHNNNKAVGTQLVYTPNKKVSLNYSTFFGNEKPDTAKQYRFHNNVYGTFQLTEKLGLVAGMDFCLEQKANRIGYNYLYAPVAILRYAINNHFAIAARGEYYRDDNGIFIPTAMVHGFQTASASLNLDYMPFDFVSIRLEGRMFNSRDKIFVKNGNGTSWDAFVTTSLAVSF